MAEAPANPKPISYPVTAGPASPKPISYPVPGDWEKYGLTAELTRVETSSYAVPKDRGGGTHATHEDVVWLYLHNGDKFGRVDPTRGNVVEWDKKYAKTKK
jgi:hypothetical protein